MSDAPKPCPLCGNPPLVDALEKTATCQHSLCPLFCQAIPFDQWNDRPGERVAYIAGMEHLLPMIEAEARLGPTPEPAATLDWLADKIKKEIEKEQEK